MEELSTVEANYELLTAKEGRDEIVKDSQKENKVREKEAKEKKDAEAKEAEAAKEKAKREKTLAKKKEKEEAKAKKAQAKDIIQKAAPEGMTQEEIEAAVEGLSGMTPEAAEIQRKAEQELTEAETSIVEVEERKTPENKEDGEVETISDEKAKEASKKEQEKGITSNKIVQGSSTIAYLSKEYVNKDGTKKTATNDKAEGLHKELESSTEFQIGDELTLEIDKAAVWQDKEGVTKSYNDFVDANGVTDVNNVPIAIKKGGVVVGYVRTQEWLNAKDEAGEYANVADGGTPGDPIYGNGKAQSDENKAIREHILKNGAVTVKINNKSAGQLSKNVKHY